MNIIMTLAIVFFLAISSTASGQALTPEPEPVKALFTFNGDEIIFSDDYPICH